MFDRSKLAAYLDEADDDPVSAIEMMKRHDIKHIVLRRLWTGNVQKIHDQAAGKIKSLLVTADIKPVMLDLDLGDMPPEELRDITPDQIDRAFNLASYFNVNMLKINCGTAGTHKHDDHVAQWMKNIQERALIANITPLLEPSHHQAIYEVADTVRLIAAYPRWKILYDPAQVCMTRKIDPFSKYWILLKNKVAAIDLHDVKIGHNFTITGQGDCRLIDTIRDARRDKYTGWYFLEPGLGRRHGTALTRRDTFTIAVNGLDAIGV